MRYWEDFTYHAEQAAEGIIVMWPVTAVLILLLLAAAIWSRSNLNALFRLRTLWQLLPLIVPAAVLAIGTLYACENCARGNSGQGHYYVWAMRTTNALIIAQLLGTALLVKLASPLRALAASFSTVRNVVYLLGEFYSGHEYVGRLAISKLSNKRSDLIVKRITANRSARPQVNLKVKPTVRRFGRCPYHSTV
jgi:hypothetical protein